MCKKSKIKLVNLILSQINSQTPCLIGNCIIIIVEDKLKSCILLHNDELMTSQTFTNKNW